MLSQMHSNCRSVPRPIPNFPESAFPHTYKCPSIVIAVEYVGPHATRLNCTCVSEHHGQCKAACHPFNRGIP